MFELTNKLFVMVEFGECLGEHRKNFLPSTMHKIIKISAIKRVTGVVADAICTPSQRFGSLNTCFQFVEFVCRGNLNLKRIVSS